MISRPTVDRFTSALLGGAIGDALGRPNEGARRTSLDPSDPRHVRDYRPWHGWRSGPRGTITDDTQLTMCVAECLVDNGFLDPDDLARRFVEWLPHGRGKGVATVKAVERLRDGVPWYLAGEDSSGNGAAMRSAPVGLLRWNDPRRLHTEAVLSALPTHRQPMAVAGAVAMAAATAWLAVRAPGSWTEQEFITAVQDAIRGLEPAPQPERRGGMTLTTLHDRIGELPGLLHADIEHVLADLYSGAYVLESLPTALYLFLRSRDDLEELLVTAANVGYDADTIAAMAGTLGGASLGVRALPQRLLADLEYREELTQLAAGLYARGTETIALQTSLDDVKE